MMVGIALLALLLGIAGGCRTFVPLAATSLAGWTGLFVLDGSPLAWLASPWAAVPFLLLAFAELLGDKHPKTPSRRRPGAVIARVASGAIGGGAVAVAAGAPLALGALSGVIGALAGTYGGFFCRARLAALFGRDLPAALAEDWFAVIVAAAVVFLAA